MKSIKVNKFSEIPKNFTGIVEYWDGDKILHKEGKFHREDGPAFEHADGRKSWYLEHKRYYRIRLKSCVVLDYYKGKYDLMWYKILTKDEIIDYPDIPGLITK